MAKIPNPAGRTGFGSYKSADIKIPRLISGLGEKKINKKQRGGGLAQNPKTGQFSYGGEVLDTIQDVSRKRDELRKEGFEGDFTEINELPEGFYELDDNSKKEVENKLGYLGGVADVFMGRKRKAQKKMADDLANIKDPKKRAEKSKQWTKYIGDNFPITEASDVGYLSSPLTAISRDIRQVAGKDTGAEVLGQGLGAIVGSSVGPAGTIAGRGIGSKVSKELVGTESSVNDILFELEKQGVDTNKPGIKERIKETVETGGNISSIVDAVTGGVGKIGVDALKKGAVREIVKKYTKKGLSEQAAKKIAKKELSKKTIKNKLEKGLSKLESPFLGEAVSTGVEGMATNQAITEATEGRDPTFVEALKSFGEAGAKGATVAGAVSGLGTGLGKLSKKGPELQRKYLNKQIVDELNKPTQDYTDNLIKLKAKADNVDYSTAKSNLVNEYGNIYTQNVDLADKITSDYGNYVSKIKENKRKATTPDEQITNADLEEINSNIAEEKSDIKVFEEDEFDINSAENLTARKDVKITPLPEEVSALFEITNPVDYINVLKNSPWDNSVKKSIFKKLIETTPDDVIKKVFREEGLTIKPSEFDNLVLKSVNPDGKIDGGDFTKAYNASEMSIDNLKNYAIELNLPSLTAMLDDMSYSEILKAVEKHHGKLSGPEQKILIVGDKAMNIMIPESMRTGVSEKSKTNQKNYRAYAKDVLGNYGIKASVKNGKFTADGINVKKINDLVQDKLTQIDPSLDLKLIENSYKRKRFGDKPTAKNGFGENMPLDAKIHLAVTGIEKLKHDLSKDSKLSKLSDTGVLNKYTKDKLKEVADKNGVDAAKATVKAMPLSKKSETALKEVDKIFNKVKGKLKNVSFGGYTSKKGIEGYIDMRRKNSIEMDVIKIAHGMKFANKYELKRFFRHELSHKIIEKDLTKKELKMFNSAIQGKTIRAATIKYMTEKRGFQGEQLQRLIDNPNEFGAYFLEGAWNGDIQLQPRGVLKKAIDALRNFLNDVRNSFNDMEFKNVHELVAVVQAGQLSRDGVLDPDTKGILDLKAGPELKKFTSEIPEGKFKKAVEAGTLIDMIHYSQEAKIDKSASPDMNQSQKTFNDMFYQNSDVSINSRTKFGESLSQKAMKEFRETNPIWFRVNKYFNQNATLLSRKYPLVRNVYNFVDKTERKTEVVKGVFDEELKPLMREYDAETVKNWTNEALETYKNIQKDEFGEPVSSNPILRILSKMDEFVQNGQGLIERKKGEVSFTDGEIDLLKIKKTLKNHIDNNEPLKIAHSFQEQIFQLASKTVYRKYKDFTKAALDRGNQITFGNSPDGASDLYLPVATIDKDVNFYKNTPMEMVEMLKTYNEEMVPSSMGGTFKPFEKMSPFMAKVMQLAYPLQLALKVSSIPLNVLGGLTGTFAAAQRQSTGIGGFPSAVMSYFSSLTNPNLWSGKEYTGRYAKHLNQAKKERTIGGQQNTYEGLEKANIRAFGKKNITKATDIFTDLVDKSMFFTNKGNEIQRTGSFIMGLKIAEQKGITDYNAKHDFATSFTSEAAGDFRTFARRSSANQYMRLVNMFKSEPQYLMQNLIALGRENPKALGGVLGYMVALGGVAGFPYAEDFFAMMDSITSLFTGRTGNVKRYMADAIGNITGDRTLGNALVFGGIGPSVGIGYSLSGATTALGVPSLIKEMTKERPSLSSFDANIPAVGIFTQQLGNIFGRKEKQTGLLGRIQSGYKTATGEGNFEEEITRMLGLTGIGIDEFAETQKYFNN